MNRIHRIHGDVRLSVYGRMLNDENDDLFLPPGNYDPDGNDDHSY